MSQSLFDQTLKLIKHRPASLPLKQISTETGISYNWLSSFHQGDIANPKYQRLQQLHDYLRDKIKLITEA